MFLKLHQFDAAGNAAPRLINVHDISQVSYIEPEVVPMGSTAGYVSLTLKTTGARENFILAIPNKDGAITRRVEPRDFERALSSALQTPGVHEL